VLEAVPELRFRGQPVVERSVVGGLALALAREKELVRTPPNALGPRAGVARRLMVLSFHGA